MLFLKNSHTNNLITQVFAFIQQTSSARRGGGKTALYAHSQGTAARREMVFTSLWKSQQWLRCTFKSLLIVKPTGNGPSCVLKSSFPTISLFIQVWTFCVNFSTCYGHCGWLQGYSLSEALNTFLSFKVSFICSQSFPEVGGEGVEGKQQRGTGHLGEEEEKSPQPRRIPTKGYPLSAHKPCKLPGLFMPSNNQCPSKRNPRGDQKIFGTVAHFPALSLRFSWVSDW